MCVTYDLDDEGKNENKEVTEKNDTLTRFELQANARDVTV
jgi:hypothetical protein